MYNEAIADFLGLINLDVLLNRMADLWSVGRRSSSNSAVKWLVWSHLFGDSFEALNNLAFFGQLDDAFWQFILEHEGRGGGVKYRKINRTCWKADLRQPQNKTIGEAVYH